MPVYTGVDHGCTVINEVPRTVLQTKAARPPSLARSPVVPNPIHISLQGTSRAYRLTQSRSGEGLTMKLMGRRPQAPIKRRGRTRPSWPSGA